ncbi:MAG: MBOAT family O-acyltransferase [Eubacteriales bacterium]
MVFSSLTFLGIFLPLALFFNYISKTIRWKNFFLLIFSLIFYSWGEPIWVLAMLFTTTINYICGLYIDKAKTQKTKKIVLTIGTIASLSILFFFKYAGFVVNTFSTLSNIKIQTEFPGLPIGISFYTFQTITYTVDVYRKKVKVQKSYFKLLLFVSMFHQLIAGPIVQYGDIAEAIDNRVETPELFTSGMKRFIIGLAKKVLIANVCAAALDNLIMAGGINQMSFAGAWYAMAIFAFQIYFDFSGYSDMAIGMGKFFGFTFRENFNYPYISSSISEFWRRWHMSLGAFFREYLYIPLGGNRVSKSRLVFNLLIVWFLTGLWHGASWNFVVWGVYYGILIIFEKLTNLDKAKIPKLISVPITLGLVLIGWAFFYYTDLSLAIVHIKAMFGQNISGLIDGNTIFSFKDNVALIPIGVFCSLPIYKYIDTKLENNKIYQVVHPIVLLSLFVLTVVYLVGQTFNPFLYFRF